MPVYRSLAKQTSHYLVAQVLGMVTGLISLPILARLLDKESFGRLSLVVLSVSFLGTFVRLGIPQSITRHLPEYRKRGPEALHLYLSSILFSSLFVSTFAAGGLGLVAYLGGFSSLLGWGDVLLVVGALLVVDVMLTVASELYRAEQRSLLASALHVLTRFGALAGSLIGFLYVSSTLQALLAGKAVVQLLIVALFCVPYFYFGRLSWRAIDLGVVREAMRYGLPLSFSTAGGFFIEAGDRYVIQAMLDSTQVARYSLPYDILQNLDLAVTTPIRMAIVPIVFSLVVDEGEKSAAEVLSQAGRGAFMVVFPMLLGVSFLSSEIVVLLGSEKYADSSSLVPVLASGVLLGGLNFIFVIVLSLRKRTDLIACVTVSSGLLNILLNVLLIPSFGVMGSAWATLMTYCVQMGTCGFLATRYIKLRFYPRSFVVTVVSGLCMVASLWAASRFLPGGALALAYQIPLGVVVYAAVLLALEKEVRERCRGLWLRRGFNNGASA